MVVARNWTRPWPECRKALGTKRCPKHPPVVQSYQPLLSAHRPDLGDASALATPSCDSFLTDVTLTGVLRSGKQQNDGIDRTSNMWHEP